MHMSCRVQYKQDRSRGFQMRGVQFRILRPTHQFQHVSHVLCREIREQKPGNFRDRSLLAVCSRSFFWRGGGFWE